MPAACRIDLTLSEGQAWDGHSAHDLLRHLEDGTTLLADRAYDANAIRSTAAQRGAWANIPSMPQRRQKPVFSKYSLQGTEPGREVFQQT